MTALTVYLSNVATSTLASAAALASTTGGTLAGDSSKIGTSTGYGQLYGLGNGSAWAAAGSIGSPDGNGWLWDVTTLEGKTISSGTWTPTTRIRFSAGTGTVDVYCRYYKRSSGGAYTLIGTVSTTGVSMTTGYISPTFSGSLSAMSFTTGDKLYMDCWLNITSNSSGSGTAVCFITVTTSATQGDATGAQVTPGYAATVVALSTTINGVGTFTPTLSAKVALSKTIHGVGTFTPAALALKTALVKTINGVGTFTPSISAKTALSKTINGVGALNPTFSAKVPFSKTINGVGTFTPAALLLKTALSKTLHGVGTLSPTMRTTFGAQLVGVGTFTPAALTLKTALSITINGVGTLSPTFSAKVVLSKTFVGVGTFTPAAYSRIVYFFKSFSGNGTLTGTLQLAWGVQIHGVGTFAPTMHLIPQAHFALTIRGVGQLIASLPRYLYVTIAGRSTVIARPVMGGSGLVVQVDGVPLFILAGTVQIQNAIARRSTAQFTVFTDDQTFFQWGQQISIFNNGVLVFSGYLSQDTVTQPGYQEVLLHQVQAVDQHYLADKRIIAAVYANITPGKVAQLIAANYLAQEGVTIGQIVDSGVYPSPLLFPGPTVYPTGAIEEIPLITFGYCTCAEALDALVARANDNGTPFYWQIDQWKQLWFVPYTALVNSVVIDGTAIDSKASVPTLVVQSPSYRNTQYLLGGVGQTVLQHETRKGDSNTTAWAMGFAIATAPTITVDTVAQDVGIKGIDINMDFYWSKGDPTITQETANAKLTSSNTLVVNYIGQYPTVIVASDNGLISTQRALEGGTTTGIVESSLNDTTVSTQGESVSYAANLLKRYGVYGSSFTFSTLQQGYQQGQLATVNLPRFNLINAQMLIENVTIADSIDSHNLYWTVTAVQGPYDTTWISFFAKLVQNNQQAPLSVGNVQTVQLAVPLSITLSPALKMTVTLTRPPFPGPTQYPSPTFYP